MNLVIELISDYRQLNLTDLNAKWADRYDKVPTVEEIVQHLKATGTLECMIDHEPFDPARASFLVQRGLTYTVFNLFRGIEVSESSFLNLEDAVTEKLKRTIVGLGGRIRGS